MDSADSNDKFQTYRDQAHGASVGDKAVDAQVARYTELNRQRDAELARRARAAASDPQATMEISPATYGQVAEYTKRNVAGTQYRVTDPGVNAQVQKYINANEQRFAAQGYKLPHVEWTGGAVTLPTPDFQSQYLDKQKKK
jgi:hypothetical protein